MSDLSGKGGAYLWKLDDTGKRDAGKSEVDREEHHMSDSGDRGDDMINSGRGDQKGRQLVECK